jgi:hypothetical protein
MVILPDGDDAAAWGTVYDRLGRPAAADKYALADPDPANVVIDRELKQRFTVKAHEAGLSQKQAATLYDWWNGEQTQAKKAFGEAQASRTAQAEKALRADPSFGGAAYDENLQNAVRAMAHYEQKFGIDKDRLSTELVTTGLGDHPLLIKMLAAIGRDMREDGLFGGAAQGAGGHAGEVLTPAEIDQRIAAVRADRGFQERYHSRVRSTREGAMAEIAGLYELRAEANRLARGETA